MRNSLGMELIEVKAGSFLMGQDDGDLDERPAHPVTLSHPMFMAATPVTNAQYEAFDPEHRRFRGVRGLSSGDREAVVHGEAIRLLDLRTPRFRKVGELPPRQRLVLVPVLIGRHGTRRGTADPCSGVEQDAEGTPEQFPPTDEHHRASSFTRGSGGG